MSTPEPKPVVAPKVPDPPAVPEATQEEAGDVARKRRFRKGRSRTFLTGALEPETTGKKVLLG